MLNLNIVKTRYFPVTIDKYKVDVEPCKVKTLNKLENLEKDGTLNDLIDVCSEILNKNKTKFKIPRNVIEQLDIDQIQYLITEFVKWHSDVRKSDPN